MLERPCRFRDAALAALEKAGRPYRIALETPSLAALRAAVRSGSSITCRTNHFMDTAIGAEEALPSLPHVATVRHVRRHPHPTISRLGDLGSRGCAGVLAAEHTQHTAFGEDLRQDHRRLGQPGRVIQIKTARRIAAIFVSAAAVDLFIADLWSVQSGHQIGDILCRKRAFDGVTRQHRVFIHQTGDAPGGGGIHEAPDGSAARKLHPAPAWPG